MSTSLRAIQNESGNRPEQDLSTPLWDTRQVAARLNVPKSWVYSAAERGEIPSRKVGKYRRFVAAEIEAWLNRQAK